jgi:hypothetical protein
VVAEKEFQQARKDNQALTQYINTKRKEEARTKEEETWKKIEEEADKKIK